MLIDVHCHLDFYPDKKVKEIIKRARGANVKIIVTNGVDVKSNRKTLELSRQYEEVKAALGLYPIDALKMSEKEIEEEIEFIRSYEKEIAAIGEVGIDFKESDEKERQKKTFRRIIGLAKEIDKPLIIHSRKAEKEVIEILEEMGANKVLMHCFNGNFGLVERIVSNGWFISIPANVKNSEHFQQIAAKFPIENLLCETDSPYLHPNREKNNEPANVNVCYEKIAQMRKLARTDVEKQIEKNFKKLFNS